ncbi:MAG: hypothetical protein HRU23_07755 [Gammaproteobacteria bacterium]|nr:hypothetical protein [Gammaproteobacteria bacterium]
MRLMYILVFFSSITFANNQVFDVSEGKTIQKVIIGYLKVNAKLMMQRSGINDLKVVPCHYDNTVKVIRICAEHHLNKHRNGMLVYSVQLPSYAYLISKVLPKVKRVLVINQSHSQLSAILNGLDIMTTSIDQGDMRSLVKAMDLPGHFDAVVLGVNHGLTKEQLTASLTFFAKQRLIVFSADPTYLSLGATIAIAPSQDEILASFTGMLQFYKLTGLLKNTPPVCVGSVRVNKRAARALNLDLSSSRLATLHQQINTACQ